MKVKLIFSMAPLIMTQSSGPDNNLNLEDSEGLANPTSIPVSGLASPVHTKELSEDRKLKLCSFVPHSDDPGTVNFPCRMNN